MITVPNLFRQQPALEARRLYSLYLSHLMAKHRERRVVKVCRQIRSHASRLKKPRSADFTFQFEIEAFCKLGRFRSAWRQLRRLERIAYGKNIDLAAKEWGSRQLDWFWNYHPHILYFLGRYHIAGRLFEALFAARMLHREEGLSYQLLPYVYNAVGRPREPQEVTLYHVYQKLGKSLSEWGQWEQFINGFNAKLFTLAGIPQKRLLDDARLLPRFYKAISKKRKQRLTSRISAGEQELVNSPRDVQRFQEIIAAKSATQDLAIAQHERLLKQLFPELRRLGC